DTGVGKTTFAIQLCVNAAMQGVAAWVNSWEMKPATVLRKIASIALRRPMKYQNFSEHENEQFDTWCSQYKVYINPNTIGTSIESLSKQLSAANEKGIQIVMLDHLDYRVNNRRDNVHEAID